MLILFTLAPSHPFTRTGLCSFNTWTAVLQLPMMSIDHSISILHCLLQVSRSRPCWPLPLGNMCCARSQLQHLLKMLRRCMQQQRLGLWILCSWLGKEKPWSGRLVSVFHAETSRPADYIVTSAIHKRGEKKMAGERSGPHWGSLEPILPSSGACPCSSWTRPKIDEYRGWWLVWGVACWISCMQGAFDLLDSY